MSGWLLQLRCWFIRYGQVITCCCWDVISCSTVAWTNRKPYHIVIISTVYSCLSRGTLEEVMNAHPSISQINPSYVSSSATSIVLSNCGHPTANNRMRSLLLSWYTAYNRTVGSEVVLLSMAGW